MDAVAAVVKDIVLVSGKLPSLVNVVHPRRSSWSDVLENVNKHLPQGRLPFIPFSDWIRKLEERSIFATAEDLNRMVSWRDVHP